MSAAIVLGASGSVGGALLQALFSDGGFTPVITLTRRANPEAAAQAQAAGQRLIEILVPHMTPEALYRATLSAAREVSGEVCGFSVLGIGAGTAALTIDQHRDVDVTLNAAFARALHDAGNVRHLAFMSAAGANPTARTTGSGAAGGARYNRVKGEAEEAVRRAGPEVVSVFRPAMIIGSRHTPWLLERLLPLVSFVTPANYRSITATDIARAMVAASRRPASASATYHYPEMMALAAGA